MNRIDRLLVKLDTITRLNEGELCLMNPRMSITTTLNNVVRVLLDEWAQPIPEEEIQNLLPKLAERFREGGIETDRAHIEWAIAQGYEPIIPILVLRYLMREKGLTIHMRHTTDNEWGEFTSRYAAILSRLDELVW